MEKSSFIKKDFKIFENYQKEVGAELIYLDSAATSQRPNQVINAEVDFLTNSNAAAHRGSYRLSEKASLCLESARITVSNFLKVDASEIIFTKSATESLNLLAYSFGNASLTNKSESIFKIGAGDEIVVTEMEHHANLVPWQELCRRTGAILKWIECTNEGVLDLSNLSDVITDRCKILAVTHQSNSLGTLNPIESLVKRAREVGAIVVLDACQSASRIPLNLVKLDVDFAVFSGHKMLGPTGIGVLYGRQKYLSTMPPFLFGGSMIENVFMDRSTYVTSVSRFEPGVPMTSQAVGLCAAINYLETVGMSQVYQHELDLTTYALKKLAEVPDLQILGPLDAAKRPGVVAFNLGEIHPHDVGQALDEFHIAVRVGHHCAKPLLRKLGVKGSVRASFHLYNDKNDVDQLVIGLIEAHRAFKEIGLFI